MMVDRARILRALEKLPEAPDGAEEFIKNVSPDLFEKNYLIYKSHKPKKSVACHCTACGSDFTMPYTEAICGCSHGYYSATKYFGFENTEFNEFVFNNQTTRCPMCSEPAKAFHITYIGKAFEEISYVFAKIHIIDGMIFYIRWHYQRFLCQDGTYITQINPLGGNVFCKDFRAYITKSFCSYNPYSGYSYAHYYKWFINVKFNSLSCIQARHIMPITYDELLNSDFPNCKLDVFLFNSDEMQNCYIAEYLNAYRHYPCIENLVMNGATYLLNSIFSHTSTLVGFREYVDVKAKSPFDMLNLNKPEYETFVKRIQADFREINFYSKHKKDFPIDYFLCFSSNYDVSELDRLTKYSYGYLKPLRYIEKQEELLNTIIPIHTLTDYWDMMNSLGVEKYNPFPKDILIAHDKAAKRQRAIKNAAKDKEYKARAKALKKYCFEYKDLIIFPCSSDEELFQEGEQLEHCVYGYADSYIKGNTALLFIRHKDKPSIPFYTLELDEKYGIIRQNHGWKNETQNEKDPDVIEFEKIFLEFVKTVKEKKNGKQRNRSKKSKSACSA